MQNDTPSILRFGLIADIHQDIMHDAVERLGLFIEAMKDARVDFICQLGDFCLPHGNNRSFLQQWEDFDGPRYHVLGNHDAEGGFTWEQARAFLGMPHAYYSFDQKGVHFMVLDGNEPGGKKTGYRHYISELQLNWMARDLAATSLPTVVLVHQALDLAQGIENGEAVRDVLEQAKFVSGKKKVVACFCGHHHQDRTTLLNAIHYIHINSASYYWLGDEYKADSYSTEIHRGHPRIASTAPYGEPLWALVEWDVSAGQFMITGRSSRWVGPNPWERGIHEEVLNPAHCVPKISDRVILFPT